MRIKSIFAGFLIAALSVSASMAAPVTPSVTDHSITIETAKAGLPVVPFVGIVADLHITKANIKIGSFPIGAMVRPMDYSWDWSISSDCFPWDTQNPDYCFNVLAWVNASVKVTGGEITMCGTPATPIELTLYNPTRKCYRYWPTAYLTY